MSNTFSKVVTGREEKTIGIEIEFFNVYYNDVVIELRRAGIQVSFEGYTHQVMNTWKLVTDVSVTGTNTGKGKGLELVSPPLTSTEMERQLKIVSEVLNDLGAKVDKTCGLHVHHDIQDLNLENIKNIYRLYNKHIDSIEEIMPTSRTKAFQERTSHGYCKGLNERDMAYIERATSIRELQTMNRYKVINFQSYVKYGTVEFRQHSGTIDFAKMFNWIMITQSLVASAKKKKEVKPLSPTANRTMAFNKDIGTFNTEQGVYFRDRKKDFKKVSQTA